MEVAHGRTGRIILNVIFNLFTESFFVNRISINPQLMDELSVSINFLTFDRDRMKLLESDVLKNPAVIRDMCVSLLLLGISTGLFLRALITPRRIARIANQNRENLAEENSAAPEQQNINVQQGQKNRFAFFSTCSGPC